MAAAVILLLLSAVLMILSARAPAFAEWYSECIYPLAVNSIGRVCGLVPFSVAEIGIYILLTAFFVTLVRVILRAAGGRKKGKAPAALLVSWLSGVLLAAGILAFLYTACCGINYHRRSFSEEKGIITYQYSADDLKEICIWLTEEINARADAVTRDADGLLTLDASERDGGVKAMQQLAVEFPSLAGYYPKPKALILSEILSYQGFICRLLWRQIIMGICRRMTSLLPYATNYRIFEDLWKNKKRILSRFSRASVPSGRTFNTADICQAGCTV